MSRPEKIIIIVLTLLLLAAIGMNFCKKLSQPAITILPCQNTKDEEAALRQIRESKIVNINTVNAYKLTELPGIGPKLAQDIINFRNTHGRFNSKEEILKVKGIGPQKYKLLKDCIKTDG